MRPDEPFLHEICTHPSDDAPRLIYADWLDEHGQPSRAEFIRAQIALTQLSPTRRRYVLLRRLARLLLNEHRAAWVEELPKWARDRCEFHRGFVHHVACTALQFIKHGEQLVRVAPVQSLRLRRTEGRNIALAKSPPLAQITALHLESQLATHEDWESFAASPYLRQLTSLRLGLLQGTDPVGILATHSWFANLTTLNLSGTTERTSERLRWLLESPHSPHPTELRLVFNNLRDQGVQRLARSPCLDRVAVLDLRWNAIGSPGAEALAASPYLANLTKLYLSGNRITDSGTRALVESPHLPKLRQLSLRKNPIHSTSLLLRQRFGQGVKL